jgi:ATP-binding cassette subfamily B protein/subfamily B ATP-binding cassette protein MsbA
MKQPVSSKQRHRAARQRWFASDHERKTVAAPKPQKRKYLRDYINWLWPYRWALLVLFLFSFSVAVLDMVWPLAIKKILDLPDRQMPWDRKSHLLNLFGAAVVVVLIAKQLIDTTRSYQSATLNARMIFRLRKKLFARLLGLPLSELSEMKSGGITSRLSGDIDSVNDLVNLALISPAIAAVRVLLTITIIFWLSPRLAMTSLIFLPPLAAISFVWLKRVRPIYRSMREDRSTIDGRVTETFGGIRVVRAFRREPREEQNYAVGHHSVIRKSLLAQSLEIAIGTIWGLLIPGISVLVVWYGGYLVLTSNGKTTVGDIFVFQIYAVLLIQPVWQIVSSVSQTQRSLAAMERVFEVLAMSADKPDVPDAIDAPPAVREIQFEEVQFEYRSDVPVIRDFNLSVPGGATVALVGPSGAGKTTITDLVARFYDPTRGVIRLNGIDLRKIKLHSYRQMIAVVMQEVFLFDGTVRENIAYGLRGATDEQILDAARRANAHEFIDRLPEAYDTLIGERGFKLSGGQRQRLSIARAILANPKILILDEATSNLDTESEQLIQQSLAELFEGRTTFVIAHRLSTITHADLIVVIDGGKIIETGRHDQLMNNRGLYFEMVERQRRSMGVNGELLDGAETEISAR